MRRMKKKIILAVFALVFSMLLPYLAMNSTVSVSYSAATVSIDPPEIHKQVTDYFEVKITVTGVTNLQGFRIMFYYNRSILALVGNTTDSMLNAPSEQYQFPRADEGEVKVYLYPSPQIKPRNGSGTLITFKFYCSNLGNDTFTCCCTLYILSEPGPSMQVTSSYSVEKITHKQVDNNYTLPMDVNSTDLGPVFAVLADDVVLDLDNHTINNSEGVGLAIEVTDRKNVTIKNGVITNFQYGIEITRCDQVNIFNITIFRLKETVTIKDSSHVRICNSNLSCSERECLSLSNCSLSEVSNNLLSNNRKYAIDMRNSVNNNISNNTISDNTPGGIRIKDSGQNTIFNNNFINNTDEEHKPQHVSVFDIYKVSKNVWNSSYPHGGNYWDDWNDTARRSNRIVDEKSGKNQTILGPDGIGDTAYVINENNQDEYPLMNPYGSVLQVCDICRVLVPPQGENRTTTLSVAVFTNSSVADFNFNSNGILGLISFNVSGQCTFCKVIVSRELLDSVSEIKVRGIPVAFFLNWDEGYVFANFTYSGGSHQVEICGEIARRCDVNRDDKVNILDISMVAKEFGSTYIYENP